MNPKTGNYEFSYLYLLLFMGLVAGLKLPLLLALF